MGKHTFFVPPFVTRFTEHEDHICEAGGRRTDSGDVTGTGTDTSTPEEEEDVVLIMSTCTSLLSRKLG